MNFDEFARQECPEISPESQQRERIVCILPEWQKDFCLMHSGFIGTAGQCTRSLDDCFISKIIGSKGDFQQIGSYEIGQGITCDEVLEYCRCDEDLADMLKYPAVFILMAESIKRERQRGQ